MLVSNTLPATKTRDNWSFSYVATADDSAVADGLLVITEEKGKRVKRTVTSTYGVQEEPSLGGRAFLLCKAGHAGDLDTKAGRDAAIRCGDVYRCVVATSRPSCSCPGYAAGGRTCKHILALAGLIETGDLPAPLLNAETDFAATESDWHRPRLREATPAHVDAAAAFLRRVG